MPSPDPETRDVPYPDLVWYAYRGTSMRGTFRYGDQLGVQPCAFTSLRPGDVVAFRGAAPEGEGEHGSCVVHRLIARSDAGWLTRGDHNYFVDTAPLTETELLGRVVLLSRRGSTRPLSGGGRGHLRGLALHWGWRLLRRLFRFYQHLGHPYRWLRERRWIPKLWRPDLRQVWVTTESGPVLKYVHRGRTVARWYPNGHFWCRRPYDLVITPPPASSQNVDPSALRSCN